MKKPFFAILTLALLLQFAPLQVSAVGTPGTLIKCPGNTAVYYLDDFNKRWVFPNQQTYNTWYADFSTVLTVSCNEIAGMAIGGMINYQPGTRMLKSQTSPTVYVVEQHGKLRAIQTQDQAEWIYGPHWRDRIDDISDAFISSYKFGDPLALNEYPEGTILWNKQSALHYYIQTQRARLLEPGLITHALADNAIVVNDPFEFAIEGQQMSGAEWFEILKTSQN